MSNIVDDEPSVTFVWQLNTNNMDNVRRSLLYLKVRIPSILSRLTVQLDAGELAHQSIYLHSFQGGHIRIRLSDANRVATKINIHKICSTHLDIACRYESSTSDPDSSLDQSFS